MITEVSNDTTYAFTRENPVRVGGAADMEGPLNERRYLASIAGPGGEEITFTRVGSCCHFETPNGVLGGGLLDLYRITWRGAKDSLDLYINMYDPGYLMAPAGLSIRK
ncbi:MAG: 2-dehydro-3-deoxyphosphooctonate aldolase [Bacteroidia bacterium]